MSWQQLLDSGHVRRHETSRRELDSLRALIDRDLRDAGLAGLSSDRCFATAYNAVLQLAKMVIACAGYRIASHAGHHRTTFEALDFALGSSRLELVTYFDVCRRKRNKVDYTMAGVASETEAAELLDKARRFRELVEEWIGQNYPQFATQR